MRQGRPDGWVVSVPWPVRLFGNVLDDLELPSIIASVDLRTAIGALPRGDALCTVAAPWLDEPLIVDLAAPEAHERVPLLVAAAGVLDRNGISLSAGYEFTIYSRVLDPLRLQGSPALAAAWTVCLLAVTGRLADCAGNEVAERAGGALAAGCGNSGGIPEINGCVLGGTLRSQPGAEWQQAERDLPGLIVAMPAAPEVSADRAEERRRGTALALRAMREARPGFTFGGSDMDGVVPRLNDLADAQAGIIYGHMALRDACRNAWELIENETGFDDDAFGELLDVTHGLLNDYFRASTPGVENLIAAAREAGALGCCVSFDGSGMVAFSPDSADRVAEAIRRLGGKAAVASVGNGMRIDHHPEGGFGLRLSRGT